MNHNTTANLTIGYDAIMRQLMEMNMQGRARTAYAASGMSPRTYAADLCTIAADGGRQNGKTEWILRNVTNDDILIVINNPMRLSLLQRKGTLKAERVFTVQEIQLAYSKDECAPFFQRCFVDSASHVFERLHRKHFYEWAAPQDDTFEHTFFLLG